jgi:multiple sugar transport system permease protein
VLVTIGQLITCTLAAFAYARLRFPGRDRPVLCDADRAHVPAQVTILPIYLGYAKLGLLNNPLGLVLMG